MKTLITIIVLAISAQASADVLESVCTIKQKNATAPKGIQVT